MLQFLFLFRMFALASGVLFGASVFVGDKDRNYSTSGTIVSPRRWITFKNFVPPWRPMVLVAATSIFALLFFEPAIRSWLQYALWKTTSQSHGLLPPYSPISYYLGYAFFHFWLWRILGVLFAGLAWWGAYAFFVRRTQGLLMDRREAFLLAFGTALSGWPNLLVYLVTFLLLYVLFLLVLTIKQKAGRKGGEGARFPVSPFLTLAMFPTALYGSAILNAIGLGSILRVSLYGV